MLRLLVSFIVSTFIFAGVIAPTAVFADQSTNAQSTQKDQKPAKTKKKTNSKTVVETQSISFKTRSQDDPNTPKGQTSVLQPGVNGS